MKFQSYFSKNGSGEMGMSDVQSKSFKDKEEIPMLGNHYISSSSVD
jgi:hypothetical protein